MAEVIKPHQFNKNATEVPETEEPAEPIRFEDLPLSEPKHGEVVIGEATDEEVALFVSAYVLQGEIEDFQRRLAGLSTINMGQHILNKGDMRSFLNPEGQRDQISKLVAPEEMREFFRKSNAWANDRARFFWVIGERLDVHDHIIGLRTKRRIVRVQRKW